jgi:very-short-patch-repair endonuclease
LAVEFDGARYHSSRSARDRDRLRQRNLENLGWIFFRIWSTDWFNDKNKVLKELDKFLKSL